jgi:hypothetical protein
MKQMQAVIIQLSYVLNSMLYCQEPEHTYSMTVHAVASLPRDSIHAI